MLRTLATALATVSLLLFSGTAVLAEAAVQAPAQTASTTGEEQAEARFLELINDARAAIGVGALVVNDELTGIARGWSAQMHAAGDLSHNPDYREQYTGEGVLSENVGHFQWPAGDLVKMVDIMHQAFMDSEGHRRNIERGRFNQVGIGVVHRDGHLWVTVNFLDGPIPAELHDAAPAARPFHTRR